MDKGRYPEGHFVRDPMGAGYRPDAERWVYCADVMELNAGVCRDCIMSVEDSDTGKLTCAMPLTRRNPELTICPFVEFDPSAWVSFRTRKRDRR